MYGPMKGPSPERGEGSCDSRGSGSKGASREKGRPCRRGRAGTLILTRDPPPPPSPPPRGSAQRPGPPGTPASPRPGPPAPRAHVPLARRPLPRPSRPLGSYPWRAQPLPRPRRKRRKKGGDAETFWDPHPARPPRAWAASERGTF